MQISQLPRPQTAGQAGQAAQTAGHQLTPPAAPVSGVTKVNNIMYESYINGMLANPTTPFMAMFSNTLNILTEPLDTGFRVLTSAFNSPEQRTSATEALASFTGLIDGTMKAAQYQAMRVNQIGRSAKETPEATLNRLSVPGKLLTESSKTGLDNRSLTSGNLRLDPASIGGRIADALGSLANAPGTVLNHIDVTGKIVSATRALNERATRLVVNGQHPDLATAKAALLQDETFMKDVANQADRASFMNKTTMGSLKWLSEGTVERIPGGRWILPFKKAIASTLEQTIERSPLRFASPDLNKQFFSSDPDIRATAQARFLTGSALLAGLTYAVKDNIVLEVEKKRGNWPSAADKALYESKFGPANSLVFKGVPGLDGKNLAIPLDNIGPMGSLLKMSKGYERWYENYNKGRLWEPEDKSKEDQFLREATSFIEPVMKGLYDNYWGRTIVEFSGIVNEAVAKNDPDRLLRFLERTGVKMMPLNSGSGWVTFVTQIEEPFQKKIDEVGDVFKSTFAATANQVSNRYTWDGHPIRASSYHTFGKHQLLSDELITEDKTRDYLLKLGVRFHEPEDYVESKPYPNGVPGARVKFTDAEWDQFQTYIREGIPEKGIPSMRTTLESLINNRQFREKFTLEEQAYQVQKMIPWIRKAYRDVMASEPGTDLNRRFKQAIDEKTAAVLKAREEGLK